MTARRSKPSFASLLRRASQPDPDHAPVLTAPPEPGTAFAVDPGCVRLWHGGGDAPTPEECRDRITAIARDGQSEPVTVRPVFDDRDIEYEVIAGARDYVAVRYLHDTAIPDLDLLVRVELVDDEGAERLAGGDPGEVDGLPDVVRDAFGDAALAPAMLAEVRQGLGGPHAPAILATAAQIARAQAARRGDGLAPYPAAEVLRLLRIVEDEPEALAERLSLAILDASDRAVTIRLDAERDLSPEMLARVVKAMIDGAAADGIAVRWGSAD
ncbi:ParB N-terminal domain-containing protein [Sphingomonas sp.]|jgi:ParB family chromosome partitioning protein|uniref:ParB N-terminal domain-containing protein n=1 Tax=Sphingomonas sp. TaxID=28214 RepID=UPI002E37B869|nr:ParB N-terminal domain-containing protein [Sphingomonas sp.]HEX4696018.1 ParB N-terminal domain-containing protein [Sphingomonas sp.]